MTTVTFRTNDELKKDAEVVLSTLGINLSQALNMFLTQLVLKQKFPCSLDTENFCVKPFYSPEFYQLFGSEKDLEFIEPDDPVEAPKEYDL